MRFRGRKSQRSGALSSWAAGRAPLIMRTSAGKDAGVREHLVAAGRVQTAAATVGIGMLLTKMEVGLPHDPALHPSVEILADQCSLLLYSQ